MSYEKMECTDESYLNLHECSGGCFGGFECTELHGIVRCCVIDGKEDQGRPYNVLLLILSVCAMVILCIALFIVFRIITTRRKISRARKVEVLNLDIEPTEENLENFSGALESV